MRRSVVLSQRRNGSVPAVPAPLPTAQALPPASLPTEPDPSPVEPRHLSFNKRSPLPICNRSCKAAPAEGTASTSAVHSCPGGHPLIRVTASLAGLECDVCGAAVPAGGATFSCEPCDFDACRRCSEEAGAGAEESRATAEGEGRKRQGAAAAPVPAADTDCAESLDRPGKAARFSRLSAGQARRVAASTGLALALCPAVARGEADAVRAAAHALGGVKVRPRVPGGAPPWAVPRLPRSSHTQTQTHAHARAHTHTQGAQARAHAHAHTRAHTHTRTRARAHTRARTRTHVTPTPIPTPQLQPQP